MLKHVQTSLTKSYSAVKTSNKPCQKSHPQSLDRLQASSGHQRSPAVTSSRQIRASYWTRDWFIGQATRAGWSSTYVLLVPIRRCTPEGNVDSYDSYDSYVFLALGAIRMKLEGDHRRCADLSCILNAPSGCETLPLGQVGRRRFTTAEQRTDPMGLLSICKNAFTLRRCDAGTCCDDLNGLKLLLGRCQGSHERRYRLRDLRVPGLPFPQGTSGQSF